jgi:hypothetical protein
MSYETKLWIVHAIWTTSMTTLTVYLLYGCDALASFV